MGEYAQAGPINKKTLALLFIYLNQPIVQASL
jgi:hypothetical protein